MSEDWLGCDEYDWIQWYIEYLAVHKRYSKLETVAQELANYLNSDDIDGSFHYEMTKTGFFKEEVQE